MHPNYDVAVSLIDRYNKAIVEYQKDCFDRNLRTNSADEYSIDRSSKGHFVQRSDEKNSRVYIANSKDFDNWKNFMEIIVISHLEDVVIARKVDEWKMKNLSPEEKVSLAVSSDHVYSDNDEVKNWIVNQQKNIVDKIDKTLFDYLIPFRNKIIEHNYFYIACIPAYA